MQRKYSAQRNLSAKVTQLTDTSKFVLYAIYLILYIIACVSMEKTHINASAIHYEMRAFDVTVTYYRTFKYFASTLSIKLLNGKHECYDNEYTMHQHIFSYVLSELTLH